MLQGRQVLLVLLQLQIQLLPRAKGDANCAPTSRSGQGGRRGQPCALVSWRPSAGSAMNCTSARRVGRAQARSLLKLWLSKFLSQLREQVPPSLPSFLVLV